MDLNKWQYTALMMPSETFIFSFLIKIVRTLLFKFYLQSIQITLIELMKDIN